MFCKEVTSQNTALQVLDKHVKFPTFRAAVYTIKMGNNCPAMDAGQKYAKAL